MKKIGFVLIGILFIFTSFVYAQQEETLTITTYYPSPYGVYNELRLFPRSGHPRDCTHEREGTMYFNSDDRMVYVCSCEPGENVPYGICSWGPMSGFWALGTGTHEDDIHNINEGNVGIGTATPDRELDVAGRVRIREGNPKNGRVLTATDKFGRAEWKESTAGAPAGSWCGLSIRNLGPNYHQGPGSDVSLYINGSPANTSIPCVVGGQNYNPVNSCPPGYARFMLQTRAWWYDQMADTLWTCIRQ